MAEPREAGETLAFRKHVASYTRLLSRQSIGEQIALNFGNPRPILHVEILLRLGDFLILGGQ
jgi:hypothetical protein